MLDQAPALEHRDVGVATLEHVHAHQVAAGRASLAGAAAAPFEHVVVEGGQRRLTDAEVGPHDVVTTGLLGR